MGIEVEAKLAVADRASFERARALAALGRFSLLDPRTVHVHDEYLDTAERALLAAGYACRRRQQGHAVIVTLKSVLAPPGDVHRREELEVVLPPAAMPRLSPAAWPPSAARDKAVQLTRGARLEQLFVLEQTRLVRDVVERGRRAALFSLDEVNLLLPGGGREQWWELELELAAEGTESDLAVLAGWVRERLGLRPAPVSKFERALGRVRGGR